MINLDISATIMFKTTHSIFVYIQNYDKLPLIYSTHLFFLTR